MNKISQTSSFPGRSKLYIAKEELYCLARAVSEEGGEKKDDVVKGLPTTYCPKN